MTITYIGLGSNLSGDMNSPRDHIVSAIQELGELQSTQMLTASSLYESEPLGPPDQDNYINAVVKLDTELEALELLDCLQVIEHGHRRERQQHWGPRTLDLDILLFGDQIIKNDRLTVPHAEISNRSFVLAPLAEIEPECVIPANGSITELITKLDLTDVKKFK